MMTSYAQFVADVGTGQCAKHGSVEILGCAATAADGVGVVHSLHSFEGFYRGNGGHLLIVVDPANSQAAVGVVHDPLLSPAAALALDAAVQVAVDLSNRIVTIGETDLSDLAVERCACLALQLGQNGAFPCVLVDHGVGGVAVAQASQRCAGGVGIQCAAISGGDCAVYQFADIVLLASDGSFCGCHDCCLLLNWAVALFVTVTDIIYDNRIFVNTQNRQETLKISERWHVMTGQTPVLLAHSSSGEAVDNAA
jgi:hypothetical protein